MGLSGLLVRSSHFSRNSFGTPPVPDLCTQSLKVGYGPTIASRNRFDIARCVHSQKRQDEHMSDPALLVMENVVCRSRTSASYLANLSLMASVASNSCPGLTIVKREPPSSIKASTIGLGSALTFLTIQKSPSKNFNCSAGEGPASAKIGANETRRAASSWRANGKLLQPWR